jgi:hypothetical protein
MPTLLSIHRRRFLHCFERACQSALADLNQSSRTTSHWPMHAQDMKKMHHLPSNHHHLI